ncbi:hypothetical protein Tsubulata_038337 [Turnera subulata]|uniref:Cytochrome P450 n=1 Tax=Turnera subulata TaxID=218843 RepID=A0A9Q0FT93_9ROSI|nr:hypothetical protein Tsubulata_038337 [Turnera subulata]
METTVLYSIFTIFVLYLASKFLVNARKKHRNHPPSPPALPIIGHLHLLKKPVHRTLDNLAQKYGPVFSLKFGSRFVVVVSSPSAVEECFTKNDIIFANRPYFSSGRYLSYNYTTLGSAPYGEHWRNLRRIAAIEILSSTRLNKFQDIRKSEVRMLIHRLRRVCGNGSAKVELRPMLRDLTFNIIMEMVAGKRFYGEELCEDEQATYFQELMNEFFSYTGATKGKFLQDLFPILEVLDFSGNEKKRILLGEKLDVLCQELIDGHRKDKGRDTMITHLLTLQESQPEYYTDQIIKGLIQNLLLAGTETTATSLEWAFANLVNHPNVLKKARAELDTQVGQQRLMEESDFSKLPYLQSIMSENSRLYPVAPLLVPHSSSSDCSIGGYHVPQGAMLFVNAWAIQRDPKLWDNPTNFSPERFEDARTEPYNLFPFGMGRRACPGDGLATRVLLLTLGSLIQCFDWERKGQGQVDMTEKGGITMTKSEPLQVVCGSSWRGAVPCLLAAAIGSVAGGGWCDDAGERRG